MHYAVFVISAGRPEAVSRMRPHLEGLPSLTWLWWVTPSEWAGSYEAEGANVIVQDGGLTRQRNAALEHAFANNVACVQLDDDLKRFRALAVDDNGEHGKADVSLRWVLDHQDQALEETGLYYCGNSPTDNLYFAKEGVSTRKFVPTPCIMVRPTHLRFDENLRLKEDYDFTLQHWATYGGAARCDFIAPSFGRYTNEGGAVSYRTPELEQTTIAYLKDKWPGMVRDNPRRPNEILLPTPRRHR